MGYRIVNATCCCGRYDPCVCCSGTVPKTQTVTFASVAAKVPEDCADCLDWNAGHSVSQDAAYPNDDDNGLCYWTAYDCPCDGSGGVTAGIILWLQCDEFGTFTYVEAFEGAGMNQTAQFMKWVADPDIDCENLGAIPIANAGSVSCDWSAATCNA